MSKSSIKSHFPILKNNPNLIYLDNAATTLKSKSVIDSVSEYYSDYSANIHRGMYPMSEKATKVYEDTRLKVANFINASPQEIIFTKSATESLNYTANFIAQIEDNPKILLSDSEHHSNILPWLRFKDINYLKLSDDFMIDFQEDDSTYDATSVSLASNVTGNVLNEEELLKLRENTKYLSLDACQFIAHKKIDVAKLDCDFLSFSAHKIFGPTGVGVLYVKKEILDKLRPVETGGGIVSEVSKGNIEYKNDVVRFEAGTPNIAGVIGLGAAVDFINKEKLYDSDKDLKILYSKLKTELKQIENIKVFGSVSSNSLPILSFSHNKIHPHDIADFLGKKNICVRAGNHCTQILHRDVFGVNSSVRVSLSVYNDDEDVERFLKGLREAIEFYG